MTDKLSVLVSGGGSIRSHAVRALLDRGWPVPVLDDQLRRAPLSQCGRADRLGRAGRPGVGATDLIKVAVEAATGAADANALAWEHRLSEKVAPRRSFRNNS